MSDQTAFEREVDEEVRQDQMLRLWKAYGPLAIGAIVAGIGLMGAYQIYGWWHHGRLERASDKFEAALEATSDKAGEEAASAFAELESAPGGYAVLARFLEADALARNGDADSAVAVYDALAGDGSVMKLYATLAGLKAAYLVADKKSPEELLERLKPQMTSDNPWLPFLRDLKAIAHVRAGDLKAAHDEFSLLASDPAAPTALRGRAGQMQEFLVGALAAAGGTGAEETTPESGAATTGGDDK